MGPVLVRCERPRVCVISHSSSGALAFLGTAGYALEKHPQFLDLGAAPVLGQDPLLLTGLAGIGIGFLAYYAAGGLYRTSWRLLNREAAAVFDRKYSDFQRRIVKYRAPAPKYSDDYYGTDIRTRVDYRKWLRTQLAAKRR